MTNREPWRVSTKNGLDSFKALYWVEGMFRLDPVLATRMMEVYHV